ncbi:uncharacterized protein K441DRAFT_657253, partial [Cenococcum geophilum 1.58]|uniref:uncharacterized protein n=1 Tax=Cenococcum geophilum 1.58 TaxID=794803 RepID=UPI00358F1FB8
ALLEIIFRSMLLTQKKSTNGFYKRLSTKRSSAYDGIYKRLSTKRSLTYEGI